MRLMSLINLRLEPRALLHPTVVSSPAWSACWVGRMVYPEWYTGTYTLGGIPCHTTQVVYPPMYPRWYTRPCTSGCNRHLPYLRV